MKKPIQATRLPVESRPPVRARGMAAPGPPAATAPGEAAFVAPAPMLCGIGEVSFLLGISRAMAWRLQSKGGLPRAIRLGRRSLWSRAELAAWIAAGAPCADRWEQMRGTTR